MDGVIMIVEPEVVVVTASTDFNPMRNLKNIEPELKKKGYSGDVVFDLLVCNGLSDNRYIQIVFNGNSFIRSTLKVLKECDQRIQVVQNQYFKANPKLLSSSVLSRAEVMSF